MSRRIAGTLGRLLQIGVAGSCALMAAGALVFLAKHGGEPSVHVGFRGEPAGYTSIPAVIKCALTGSPLGIIQLAALAMIATPILRVVFAFFGFLRARDWRFVAVSGIVLALLAVGLVGRT